jgi:hypothetical protein
MNKNNFRLKIENPCNQDWSRMKSIGSEKFCSSCSKSVTDLSNLSNSEISTFINNGNGKVCARLNKNQINNLIAIETSQNNFKSISKIFAASLILIGLTKSGHAKERTITHSNQFSSYDNFKKSAGVIEAIASSDSITVLTLKGTVFEEKFNKESIPFASISIEGTEIAVTTDFDGNFTLEIPDTSNLDSWVLKISYVGYKTISKKIKRSDFKTEQQYFMLRGDEKAFILGEVCVEHKKRWWKFWK